MQSWQNENHSLNTHNQYNWHIEHNDHVRDSWHDEHSASTLHHKTTSTSIRSRPIAQKEDKFLSLHDEHYDHSEHNEHNKHNQLYLIFSIVILAQYTSNSHPICGPWYHTAHSFARLSHCYAPWWNCCCVRVQENPVKRTRTQQSVGPCMALY